MKRKRLGEVLRERGQISGPDLKIALQEQQGKLVHLGELMLQRGMVSKADLASALNEVSNVPYLDCTSLRVPHAVLKLIPHQIARRLCVLPVGEQESKLVAVMAEPQNLQTVDELRFKTGMEILPRLGFRADIVEALNRNYGPPEVATPIANGRVVVGDEDLGMEFISVSAQQRNVEAMREIQAELQLKSKTTPAVLVVASTIRAAATRGASDIHVEPQAGDTIIRFRVDGMLRDYKQIPRALQNSVASRIKILSDMDIAERRSPQDGRFLVRIGTRRVDLRVSTLPTQYGEKVVMRLLDSDAPLQDLATLGFPPRIDQNLTKMLHFPQGMILVTGPTGSGKSTTLYSALQIVRRPSVNIITVEDPVEYVVPGLNQVQVNTKGGLTFASCLRSILRQDPNVIMVGEIRDKETAEIALKAAQTGHLVLSTLHTNDSISAVTRLLDLGVPGFQIAVSVTAIIAQRLIRRLCACHTSGPITPQLYSRLLCAGMEEPPATQFTPEGCENCDLTGYKGRVGIYEMLVFDDGIRQVVRSGGKTDDIRAIARLKGMKLMQEYALEHVREGDTTLDEVERVVPFELVVTGTCSSCTRELSPDFAFCPHCGEKRIAAMADHPPSPAMAKQGVVSE